MEKKTDCLSFIFVNRSIFDYQVHEMKMLTLIMNS